MGRYFGLPPASLLVGQGPTYVDQIVAGEIDETACTADQAVLRHTRLNVAQLAKMRNDLTNLPPMQTYYDSINLGERFWYLSRIVAAAHDGPAVLKELGVYNRGAAARSTVLPYIGPINDLTIDWDVVLRVGNSWFDRLAKSVRLPSYTGRKKALDALADEIDDVRKAVEEASKSGLRSYIASLSGKSRNVVSERIGTA